MRIVINSETHRFRLCLPTGLLLNSVTAGIMSKALQNTEAFQDLSRQDLRRLFREMARVKRKFPDLDLVNIVDANGDHIIIRL